MTHKILILEDNSNDATLIVRALKRGGVEFSHRVADKKDDFVMILGEYDPDIVVSDFRLVDFDGNEALRIARAYSADLPVVIVSGTLGDELAAGLVRAGAADYLLKNSLGRLPGVVQRVLEEREQRLRRATAEAESRAYQQRLAYLYENSSNGILMLGPRGEIVDANPAACAILQASQEQLAGRKWAEMLLEPDDAMGDPVAHDAGRASRVVRSVRTVDGEGSRIIALDLVARHEDASHRPLGYVIFSDITDRIRMEREREREHELQRILREIAEDLVLKDDLADALADGMRLISHYLECDVGHLFLYDRGRERLYSTDCWSGAEADELDSFRRVTRAVDLGPDDGPIGATLHSDEPSWIEDISAVPRFRRKPEALAAGMVSAVVLPLVVGKLPAGVMEFYSRTKRSASTEMANSLRLLSSHLGTIIERRWLFEDVLLRQHELEVIVASAPDMVARIDNDRRFAFVSHPEYFGSGLSASEMVGKPVSVALVERGVDERAAREWDACLAEVLASGTPRDISFSFIRDGGEATFESRIAAASLPDQRIAGAVSFTRDVTEKLAMQNALRRGEEDLLQAQRMESIGRLAGGVAHDFNNILTAMGAYVHLSHTSGRTIEQILGYVDSIKESIARAARLTHQLLLFSRKAPGEKSETDINKTVSELVKMLRRLVGDNITLETKLDRAIPPLLADAGKIEQILMNLVVNARDAMPEGGAVVIETRHSPGVEISGSSRDCITIAVSDTGSGMDGDVKSRIFEPFFTTKDPDKGTGLGLAVVYGIVREHDGIINVTSEPGKGTTFEIELPITVPAAERPAAAGSEQSASEKDRPICVLVVEDNGPIREAVIQILRADGMTVVATSSVAEARKALQGTAQFDAVFSDTVLPDGSGVELLGSTPSTTKFVFTSGYLDNRSDLDRIQRSSHSFIQKPFDPEKVLAAIRRVAGGN